MTLLSSCRAVDESVPVPQEGQDDIVVTEQLDYVFYTLNDKEKETYSDMIGAVNRRENEFPFPEGFGSDEMHKLFTLLYMQQERIFWLDSRFYCDEEQRKLYLMYRYDEAQADNMRVALDLEAGRVIAGFEQGATDYDKLLAIHDAIVLSGNFSWDSEYASTAYGALVDGSAMCEGYAFAFSYLCTAAGIENYVVSGTNSDGDAHLWNKAVCDGKWYNVDCTWDDPILKNENEKYLRHDYFLVSDEEINGISHFPDTSILPAVPCTDKNGNYFIRNGLYYDNASDGIDGLSAAIKSAAVSKSGEAEIRFSNEAAFNEASAYLFNEQGLKEIIEELNANDGLKISSAHHTVNSSLYVIHISLS
ncbi:MAG: transglutaminase domain-containing protein [Oscillospiraceae bacterium]